MAYLQQSIVTRRKDFYGQFSNYLDQSQEKALQSIVVGQVFQRKGQTKGMEWAKENNTLSSFAPNVPRPASAGGKAHRKPHLATIPFPEGSPHGKLR